ncbi:MAG TPA: hypothetical protein DDW93_08915, partial [Firmicutes bacterium]|nr:hypothetical protein [Bacillota bacterium]
KLQTMIAGGSAPDVFWLDPTIQMPSFAEKGVLLDLGPLIEEDQQLQQNLDSYHKVALDSGVYKGITYGLPWVYNPEALFYNKKIIAEAGLAVPDGDFTISDLIEAAKKMVKKSKEGRVEQYGFGGGNWYGFVWRFGGEIFDDHDYPTKCTLDSPESIEGLQFYQDLVYKEKVSPTPAASKALPTEEMFTTGRLGMIAAGGWVVPKFKEISAFEWGSTNMPKGKRQVSAAWSTLTVASANTKHPKEAWEFIKFYASKTAQEICLKGGISTIPVLKMSTTPKTTEQTQGVFLSAQDGKMWPMLPQYAKIMDKINSELDYLIMNKHDATKVARNMVKNVNPILSSK